MGSGRSNQCPPRQMRTLSCRSGSKFGLLPQPAITLLERAELSCGFWLPRCSWLVWHRHLPLRRPQGRFVVVLDAAHGGDDTGGRLANGDTEKNFTLALQRAAALAADGAGHPGGDQRESDAGIDPNHRAEIANHANAQACLSLHASESGSGTHLFALIASAAPRQNPAARPLCRLEDRAGGLGYALLALAGVLNSALQHAGMTVTLGRAALPGVDSMACPAVAVEIAPERNAGPADHCRAGRCRLPGSRGRGAGRGAVDGEAAQRRRTAMIPRHQRPSSSHSAGGFAGDGRGAVAVARARPPAADRRRGFGAHAGARRWPRQSRPRCWWPTTPTTRCLPQARSLPLPADPGARARAVLGKLLEIYAAPDAAHPVPAAPAPSPQVFLLPAPNSGATEDPPQPDAAAGGGESDAALCRQPSLGLETETLTVLSICGTLHANLPRVTQVRFLVDGQRALDACRPRRPDAHLSGRRASADGGSAPVNE